MVEGISNVIYSYAEIGIFAVIGAGVYQTFKNKKYKLSNVFGGIAVAIGVLGTFSGIYMGLIEFNTSNISDSIVVLLDGLKLAFETSILAMFLSTILKSTNIAVKEFRKEEDDNSIEVLMRNFTEEFRSFKESMTQSNTDALEKALQEMVSKFNNNLITEFGENFKRLDLSVGKMLDWQKAYKESIEINTSQLQNIIESVKTVDITLENIGGNAKSISEMSSNIEVIFKKINTYEEDVRIGLISILDTSKNIKNINEQYSSSVKNLESLSTEIDLLLRLSKEQITSQENTLKNVFMEFENIIRLQVKEITEASNNEIANSNKRMETVFTNNIDKMNDLMKHGVEGSIESLGNCIAAISEKVVEDYAVITDKLRNLGYM